MIKTIGECQFITQDVIYKFKERETHISSDMEYIAFNLVV